jgi:pantetheine-phosphate adenylyltransferase
MKEFKTGLSLEYYISFISEFTSKKKSLFWEVLDRYKEKHRFYHNIDHIYELFEHFYLLLKTGHINTEEYGTLLVLSLYHDAIYDPKSLTNEEDSAELYLTDFGKKDHIYEAILDTKYNRAFVSPMSGLFTEADLKVLTGNVQQLIAYEKKVFKEFQFVDWKIYKAKRIEILKQLIQIVEARNWSHQLDKLVEYVENFVPKIAIYAGSFNPFHIGHMYIVEKAEEIFDKVIIARGRNSSKTRERLELPKIINHHQIENYEGYLTDLINSLEYDVVVVRGIRDAIDLEYEKKFYFYCKKMKPDLKMVNIFTSPELQSVSSSGILELPVELQKQFLFE